MDMSSLPPFDPLPAELSAGLYVARRDVADLRLAFPQLDTATGMTREILEPERPLTVEELAAGALPVMVTRQLPMDTIFPASLHQWRAPQIDALGFERGTTTWWDAFLERFYPELTDDTVFTLYRGLTKEVGDTVFDVPAGGLQDIGAFWSLNPIVASSFAGLTQQHTAVATVRITLGQIKECAGLGNGMVRNNNLTFATGAASIYADEMAVVLDYRLLPASVKDSAQVFLVSKEASPRSYDRFNVEEHVNARGAGARRFLRAYTPALEERVFDDFLASMGVAARRLASGEDSGWVEERLAGLRADLEAATLDALLLHLEWEAGVSIFQQATPSFIPVSSINNHAPTILAFLRRAGLTFSDVRSVLVSDFADDPSRLAHVDLAAYRASSPELKGAIEFISDTLGVSLLVSSSGERFVSPAPPASLAAARDAFASASPSSRSALRTALQSAEPLPASALLGCLSARRLGPGYQRASSAEVSLA